MILSIFILAAKPVHAGHWKMIEGISQYPTDQEHIVLVLTSHVDRARPGQVRVTGRDARFYWTEYLFPHLPDNVQLSVSGNPFAEAHEYIEDAMETPEITEIWLWAGDKDTGRFSRFESSFPKVRSRTQSEMQAATGMVTPNVSGTAMRDALKNDDMETFMEGLPEPLTNEEREEVWALFKYAD